MVAALVGAMTFSFHLYCQPVLNEVGEQKLATLMT